uniref:WhiB family transcriptional regulator n=1 Tax=Pseudonocardia sp. CA-138482 TaxID=3240023 RepID=UPI003F49270E
MSRQPDWRHHALCRQSDPELFFPKIGVSARHALEVCQGGCPVVVQCLLDALRAPRTRSGIWGATTEQQRRELRRRGPDSWPRLDDGLSA